MNTDETQQKFVCECGKSFETQIKLSRHKTHCKVFQANKSKEKLKNEKQEDFLMVCSSVTILIALMNMMEAMVLEDSVAKNAKIIIMH